MGHPERQNASEDLLQLPDVPPLDHKGSKQRREEDKVTEFNEARDLDSRVSGGLKVPDRALRVTSQLRIGQRCDSAAFYHI